jgi:hypothetical protein
MLNANVQDHSLINLHPWRQVNSPDPTAAPTVLTQPIFLQVAVLRPSSVLHPEDGCNLRSTLAESQKSEIILFPD